MVNLRDYLLGEGLSAASAERLRRAYREGASLTATLPFPEAQHLLAGDPLVVRVLSVRDDDEIARYDYVVAETAMGDGHLRPRLLIVAHAIERVSAAAPWWEVTLRRLDVRKLGPLRLDVEGPPAPPDRIVVERGQLDAHGLDIMRARERRERATND